MIKLINKLVIKIKAFKNSQRLKMYKMLLEKYFQKEKIELVFYKIKSFNHIKRKITYLQLINKARLEKRLKFCNKKKSAILIIVKNSMKTSQLFSKK